MLAAASETLHRLRQEDNYMSSEESQRAARPSGAQDSEGDSDESDSASEVWEDAEDNQDIEVDEEQLVDLDQRQPGVGASATFINDLSDNRGSASSLL